MIIDKICHITINLILNLIIFLNIVTMKKLLILLIYIVFVINVYSQLAPVGTKWTYESMVYDMPKTYYRKMEFKVEGDTIINGTTYSVINGFSKAFYTKENSKIFYTINGEKLLFFDFDVKIGDTLLVDYSIGSSLVKKHPVCIRNVFFIKDTITNDSLKAIICVANRSTTGESIAEFLVVEKILTHYCDYDYRNGFYQRLMSYPFNYNLLGNREFESNVIFKCYSEQTGFNFKLVDDCNKVGVKNVEQTIFEIYPNPVTNFLYIKNSKTPIESISIYNVFGALVYHKNQIESAIDLHNIPTGIYFIEVKSNSEFYKQKIIKE